MTDEKPKGDIAIMFRPNETGAEWIEELRIKHNVKRTDVLRQALHIAAAHQPELEKRLAAVRGKF